MRPSLTTEQASKSARRSTRFHPFRRWGVTVRLCNKSLRRIDH
jgi:hypothetical protein